MNKNRNKISRRDFLVTTGKVVGATTLANPLSSFYTKNPQISKKRLAIVGTGHRATGMFGRKLKNDYSEYIQYAGLCDINPGRLKYAREYIDVDCPIFTDFDKMIKESAPEILLVTTIDSTHHEYIIKGLEYGLKVITEKPMTTDEVKVQAILDAERKTGNSAVVSFNYRYSPHRVRIKEMLMDNIIGDIRSVDFHWYLNTEHGPRYFRRWHGRRDKGGTLLVHKSTHHFDLLNWWLDSDPEEVVGHGALEYFGKYGSFRSQKCRGCPHKDKCDFFYDITEHKHYMRLYVENEKYDGYLRDGCIWRNEIDIFDKMSVLIKYANKVQVTYSLTTLSPYEGYRIAFNGTKGRLETWIHEKQPWPKENYDELRLTRNFGETELIQIPHAEGGHGGGDIRLKDKLFKDPDMPDPLKQSAGTRDGAMSVLIGVAARKSIDTGNPIRIGDLTELKPQAKRPV